MLIRLSHVLNHYLFWLLFVIFGISLEAVAFYYQYVLEDLPCVLCVHFRLVVAAMIIFAMLGLFVRKSKWLSIIVILLLTASFLLMAERAYQLLGVERGFILGECSMASGLPSWFAVGEWVPWFFKVETTCGYTPIVAFGVTMAESLLVMSILLVIFSLFMLWVKLKIRAS